MFYHLFGQIFGQIDQKYNVQLYWDREIPCTGLLGQKMIGKDKP